MVKTPCPARTMKEKDTNVVNPQNIFGLDKITCSIMLFSLLLLQRLQHSLLPQLPHRKLGLK